MTETVQLPDRQPTLRVVPMPADTNYIGDIFGGWIMAQVDTAGSLPALARAGGRVVTVAVTSFAFRHPVHVGDVVSFYAEIIEVGETSVTVTVEAYAERVRDPRRPIIKVTEATLVYVAVDDEGCKRVLPHLPDA